MKKGKKVFLRVLLSILGVAAVACIAVFCFYMVWEKAPDIEPQAPTTKPIASEKKTKEETVEGLPFDTERQDGVYTILLVGNDDGTGNTDTIIVGKIDTVLHKMDFVSIPRDTLINVDWSVRKLNSVYWSSKNSGGTGIDSLGMHIKNLIGFDVDCYAVIDLNVFIDVVDALGGVDFDVPVPMHYQDVGQNLYIDLEPGMQHLDGYQAMGLCRFRYGYANGDFGRMEMQQRFLKSCAEQFISMGNIPNISKVVKILSDGLDTNLSAANIAFFLRQALLCAPEDINFYTAPSDGQYISGYSYAVIDLYPWLDMVNTYLNPYDSEVGYGNVNIVYRDGGGYAATTSLLGAWYYAAPAAPEEEEAETEPEGESEGPTIIVIPSPGPAPETSPDPETSPEPGTNPEPESSPEIDTSPEPETGDGEAIEGVFA